MWDPPIEPPGASEYEQAADLAREVRRLRAEVAEWKHRAIGGTCRILSQGDTCECSLCKRDKVIRAAGVDIANLKNQLREADEEVRRLENRIEELEG